MAFSGRFPHDLNRTDEVWRRRQEKRGDERPDDSEARFEVRTVTPILTCLRPRQMPGLSISIRHSHEGPMLAFDVETLYYDGVAEVHFK